jgi:competence protein ComEA
MFQQRSKDKPPWPQLVLRWGDQAAVALITLVSLVVIAGWLIWQGRLRGRLIDIETAEPVAIQFQIDINQADWPEIALLPNVGEQLAKRIVADRAANGSFHSLEDLDRVRGIGPKTVESMKPYLRPVAPQRAASNPVGAESAGAN